MPAEKQQARMNTGRASLSPCHACHRMEYYMYLIIRYGYKRNGVVIYLTWIIYNKNNGSFSHFFNLHTRTITLPTKTLFLSNQPLILRPRQTQQYS